MPEKYIGKITRDTDWGGDLSTGGLPVAGSVVQSFIKDELKGKIGAIYKPEGSSNVYCFANAEDKEQYILTEDENLIMEKFETVSKYDIKINSEKLSLSHSVIDGETGNTIDFEFKIVDANEMSADAKASIEFSFTGSGISNKFTYETTVVAGEWTPISVNIDKYLRTGANSVAIKITGMSTLASTQFIMTYNLFDLSFIPSFSYNSVQTGNTLAIPYVIECSETKYLEFFLDGEQVSSSESMVINDIRKDSTATLNIAGLDRGIHTLQIRAYVKANDGTLFYTPLHYYTFAVEGQAEPSFLMYTPLPNDTSITLNGNNLLLTAKQFEQITFDWSIYDYLFRKLTVIFEYEGKIMTKAIIDRNGDKNTFSFRPMNDGNNQILKIYALGENKEKIFEHKISLNISETSSGIKEATDGLLLKLQSTGRRNTDADRDIWECVGSDGQTYKATFNDFVWNGQNGWNEDTESLVISNGSTIDFNIAPMERDWANNGGTIEIDLETFDIEDDDAVICKCENTYEGEATKSAFFKITSTSAEFETKEGIGIHTRYKDNERLKVAFIGNKKGGLEDSNMIYIVVNGVLERAAMFQDTDSIYSKALLKIGDPEGKCKVRLRSIRVYNRAITVDEAFNNFVVDSDDVQAIYERNNVLKPGTSDVGFEEVANKIPVMIFTGDMVSLCKNGQTDKAWRYFDVEYINRLEPERNFVSFNAQMKLQGTSSLGYPRKNFKMKTKDSNSNQETFDASNYELDTENSVVGNLMLKNKKTGKQLDFGDLQGACYTFDYQGKILKKGKYRFRADAHKADKWTLKADFMESSCSHNVGGGRSWNKIFENVQLNLDVNADYTNQTYNKNALVTTAKYKDYTKNGVKYHINNNDTGMTAQNNYVCRTEAQKIVHAANADAVRTAVDGFPMVCFYRTSHASNELIFMGQYNFINDKGSYEVFGFQDIEDPNDEETMIYDASQVECWEGLKNAHPVSLFIDQSNFDKGWKDTFESRYPDPDDEGKPDKRQVDVSNLKELCAWITSTRHADDTVYGDTISIDSSFAERINGYQYGYAESTKDNFKYAKGTNLVDNAENRQKKFETEKWEHFDMWKVAGYYIYLMRYGAVDQFVKNTMLFTDGNGKYDARTDGKYRKWFFINYDNDCLFGLRNNGELAFDWTLDRQTRDGAADIQDNGDEETGLNTFAMMGHESTLWNNLEADDEFMRMVRDLDSSMNAAGLNYNNMVKEFDTDQTEQWCERIYNANERYKYIAAAKGLGDMEGDKVNNLWMLQGTRRSHRHWWIANHFNLLDAKWLSGNYKNNFIEMKVDSKKGEYFDVIAGADYYFAWGTGKRIYESNIQKKKNETLRFTFNDKTGNQVQGDPIYIYAYNKMTEIDFSNIASTIRTGSFRFNLGDTLVQNTVKRFIIGNPNVRNSDTFETVSTWGNGMPNLEYLDITNFSGIKTLPLEDMPNLRTLKASGSGIRSFAPAEGSTFDLVELPNSISTLKLNNVSFEGGSLSSKFSYVPTTNLSNLSLSNNNGLGIAYYNLIIKPWITAMEASTATDALYSEAYIDISDIDWAFRTLDELRLFKNFKKYEHKVIIDGIEYNSFNMRGKINISSIGNLSMENIDELKSIFGENCFNETLSPLYIVTPDSIFIQSENESVPAGQENRFTREIYPDENAIADKVQSIQYYIVEETTLTKDENANVLHDNNTNKSFLPITNLNSVRNGLTLTSDTDKLGKYAIVKADELVLGNDTTFTILVSMNVQGSGNIDKVSFMDFTILDPTYAKTASITGSKSLYKNQTYTFKLNPLTVDGKMPIGSYTVNWSLSSENDGLTFVESSEVNANNQLIYTITTNADQPAVSSDIKLVANITNHDGTTVRSTITMLILNEQVIMTNQSNPTVLNICNANGWTDSADAVAMTKTQAKNVASIGTSFNGLATEFTFNELVYFEGLTSLSDSAFANSNLKSVVLPTTITSIGKKCFENCSKLTDIYIEEGIVNGEMKYKNSLPSGVTTIQEECFKGCTSLSKMILGENVVTIENYAFGNTNFEHLLIGEESISANTIAVTNNLGNISPNVFETQEWSIETTTNKLKTFSITSGMTNIGKNVYGTNLEKIIVDDSNTTYKAVNDILYSYDESSILRFPPMKNMESYENHNLSTIEAYAFASSEYLKDVILENNVAYGYGTSVFENSKVINVTLISQVQSEIPSKTFKGCKFMETCLLPDLGSLANIGFMAFYDCEALTNFVIPSSVVEFTSANVSGKKVTNTFVNCNSLTELVFPDNVTSLASNTVVTSNDASLVYIKLPKYLVASTSQSHYTNVIDCPTLSALTLPMFSETKVGGDTEGTSYEIINTDFDFNIIKDKKTIKELRMNKDDDKRNYNCFDGILYTIDTKYGDEAGCGNYGKIVFVPYPLENVTIHEGTTMIPSGVFTSQHMAKKVYMTDSVKEFEAQAFYCTAIEEMKISKGLEVMGNACFSGNTCIKSLEFGEKLTEISQYAFNNCSNLQSLSFASETLTIKTWAFASCIALSSITFNASEAPTMPGKSEANPAGNDTGLYQWHPFGWGVGYAGFAGGKTASQGINRIYVAYNAEGYDSTGDSTHFSWVEPVQNASRCGYEIAFAKFNENSFSVKVYKDGTLYTDEFVYAVSESNEYKYGGSTATGQYQSNDECYKFIVNNNIYLNEKIYIYADSSRSTLLGIIIPKLGKTEYQVGEPTMSTLRSKARLMSTAVLGASVEEETVEVKKTEYDNLVAKVNYINEVLNKML